MTRIHISDRFRNPGHNSDLSRISQVFSRSCIPPQVFENSKLSYIATGPMLASEQPCEIKVCIWRSKHCKFSKKLHAVFYISFQSPEL
jgi:hypothetical protein